MLLKLFRCLRANKDGTSTIEFVLIFPGFLALFLVAYESGLMMVRNVLLERGVDLAVRDLRLAGSAPPSFDQLKAKICREALVIAAEDCDDTIQVQLEPVDTTNWVTLDDNIRCIDQDTTINPLDETTFTGGGSNELMMVRVCALYQPMFKPTGWGMQMPKADDNGNYALVVKSAFVNEPTD
ncbi:MAG: pilus assembly protein [Pseudomonadota bacterium]